MWLITGGAGFIGSHLAARLVADGQRVRVLDNLASGKLANLQPILSHLELVTGDVRDESIVRAAMKGVSVVLHQAAQPSVPLSVADPATTYAVNVTGTLNVLTAARDAGARRVVLASTSAIYGDDPTSPKVETLAPKPISPYASSKLADEAPLCGLPELLRSRVAWRCATSTSSAAVRIPIGLRGGHSEDDRAAPTRRAAGHLSATASRRATSSISATSSRPT